MKRDVNSKHRSISIALQTKVNKKTLVLKIIHGISEIMHSRSKSPTNTSIWGLKHRAEKGPLPHTQLPVMVNKSQMMHEAIQ